MKLTNFQTDSASKNKIRRGFSIVEVAIAMGVVTLLLTTFLGVFGPAQQNITRALSSKDANRMKDALINEMSILRASDTSYNSSFDKAFKMLERSHDSRQAVLMYQYKAKPEDDDNDGILPAFAGTGGIQGRDYIIQTAVRSVGVDDVKLQSELAAESVDGSVFVVRMTQLVRDPSSSDTNLILSPRDTSGITDPNNPGPDITAAENYPDAVIAFRAEFFRLKSNNFNYITSGAWNFENIGNSVSEINMAIRR